MSRNTDLSPLLEEEDRKLSKEEILLNEDEILFGLLEAGSYRNSSDFNELIEIKRKGKLLFKFRIRPLSEEETLSCLKQATKYSKPKRAGEPRVALDTDISLFRSLKIYESTVEEDRKKVWDNKRALEAYDALRGVEIIDKVLLSGEKDLVCDKIEEISGIDGDTEETAKN